MPKPSSPPRLTIDRFLRGRGQRRWAYSALVLIVALLLMLADRSGLLVEQGDDLARYDGRWFTVLRVVDGDTVEIDAPDGDEAYTRVRLWGVDTPEMAKRDPPMPAEPFAEEATDFTRDLVQSRRVRLILEPHRLRGNYGRLLAFVEMSDGKLLNEELISAGLTRADDRWSHRYIERFADLQREAKSAKRGLWGS
ncbi:MAG: thermonuclease family protein [Phycisphaerales bacterium]